MTSRFAFDIGRGRQTENEESIKRREIRVYSKHVKKRERQTNRQKIKKSTVVYQRCHLTVRQLNEYNTERLQEVDKNMRIPRQTAAYT